MKKYAFQYNPVEIICGDLKIIFICDDMMGVPGETGVHMHSFWELFYVKEGYLKVDSEKQNYELFKHQALLVPPNSYHHSTTSENCVKRSVFFTYEKIKGLEVEESLFAEVHNAFSKGDFYILENCKHIGMLLGMILENISTEKIGKKWRIEACVTELVFSLCDSVKNENLWDMDQPLEQNVYWIYKYAIDRLLDMHYMDDISLDELAEKLFVSSRHISRIISLSYGKSFNELKLELKIRNAKKMLRDTNFSIGEISQRIGYTTERGFLSAFAKYEGCTPSEYRKKSKNKNSEN